MANIREFQGGDYGSEFEYDSEIERKRKKRQDLAAPAPAKKSKLPSKREVTTEYSKEEWRNQRLHVLGMDAYARHKKYVNDYLAYYCGSKDDFKRDTTNDRTDMDVIRENHRFMWTEDDEQQQTWEKMVAKKYWDKLYKEYAICDLSRYKENKIAMRWQVEKEVILGKGQFICGNKRCEENEGLRSWEVNFGYVEHGQKKNTLVKLRLCPECSYKLNYHHKKKEVTKQKASKHKEKHKKKHKKEKKRRSRSRSRSRSKSPESPKPSASTSSASSSGPANVWSGPAKVTEEKSREEEYDDYFEDMLL